MTNFWKYLHTEHGFTKEEVSRFRYVILSLFSEFSKMIFLGIVFFILGLGRDYLLALITLCIIRSNTGGLHFNHHFTCLLVSGIFFFTVLIVFPYAINQYQLEFLTESHFILVGLLVCILIFGLLKPVQSIRRNLASRDVIKKSKIQTFQIIFIFGILVYVLPPNPYIIPCYYTILLQAFQLIVANILSKLKLAKNNFTSV